MDFSVKFDTFNLGWSIVDIERPNVIFSKHFDFVLMLYIPVNDFSVILG